MKTVGDLNLKPGDVVKRECGALGIVCVGRHAVTDTTALVRVWWQGEPCMTTHTICGPISWEVVPKPVPTVASLGLAPGDVVRWEGANYLVQSVGSELVHLIAPSGQVSGARLASAVPKDFSKVVTG